MFLAAKTAVAGPRRLALALALLGAMAWAADGRAADTFTLDKGHTKVIFKWNHLGISDQYGRFKDFDGTLVFDQEKPENSRVEVTIKTASVDTDVPALDAELIGENFFNAKKHPEITFVSTAVRRTGARTGKVTGDLTINGVTRPVTLQVTFNFAGEHPLSGFLPTYKDAYYTGFSARTTVLRSEFDVAAFAPMTSDAIDIIIETEMRRVQ